MIVMLSCLVELVVVLDASVVNVALPAIRGDLSFSVVDLTWVVNGYALPFAGFLLLGGRLGDLRGRAWALEAGTVLFVAASAVGGAAQSPAMLITARVAQGAAAALLAPTSLAILTATFPEGPERARALGMWTAVAVAGGALGNVLGGVLTDALSWRWVFFVNLPIGAFVLLLSRAKLSGAHRRGSETPLDASGAAAATIAVAALCCGLVTGRWELYPLAALAGLGLALRERSARSPLIPPALLRRVEVSLGNLALLVAGMALMPMWFFLTLRMQDQLGYSPLVTGIGFLPLAAATVAASILLPPRLGRRLSPRALAILGAVVITVGFALLAVAPVHSGYVLAILVPSLLIGTGGGIFNPPITSIATTVGAPGLDGAASGLANASKQLGSVLGLSLVTALTTDEQTAFALLAAIAVATAAVVALLPTAGPERRQPDGAVRHSL